MKIKATITHLRENSELIHQMVKNMTEEKSRRRPDAKSWSMLEVINHLADEEREDFRAHLDLILHRPDEPWSRIDPQGWVTQRGYNERNYADSVADFLQERQRSLDWLAKLDEPKWEAIHPTPWGHISAGDMMASWVAHDLLHIRQLVELKWSITLSDLAPYQVDYAGGW